MNFPFLASRYTPQSINKKLPVVIRISSSGLFVMNPITPNAINPKEKTMMERSNLLFIVILKFGRKKPFVLPSLAYLLGLSHGVYKRIPRFSPLPFLLIIPISAKIAIGKIN